MKTNGTTVVNFSLHWTGNRSVAAWSFSLHPSITEHEAGQGASKLVATEGGIRGKFPPKFFYASKFCVSIKKLNIFI